MSSRMEIQFMSGGEKDKKKPYQSNKSEEKREKKVYKCTIKWKK